MRLQKKEYLALAVASALTFTTGIAHAAAVDEWDESPFFVTPMSLGADEALWLAEIERRRPGKPPQQERGPKRPPIDPDAIPPPSVINLDAFVPVPDRWRIMESLGITPQRWWDPYNQNTYKADKPIHGEDWFLSVNLISDTVIEPRSFPLPVGPQTTTTPGSLDVFGDFDTNVFAQTFIAGLVYYQGNTVYQPPSYEFRVTFAFQWNRVTSNEVRLLRVDPRAGTDRQDKHLGLQELFADYHIRNVSDRYDFDSIRLGIQPFSADFRGFLFLDVPFGIRYFGNRDNNKWQYNLAWFRPVEKDINSGLNDIREGLRDSDIFIFNFYRQDWPKLGFFSQGLIAYNHNRETDFKFDENGFIQRPASLGFERPRKYDVVYFGYNGDGHFGRVNLTVSAYLATGQENTAVFTDWKTDILAGFGATEVSMDFDWTRIRLSGLWASGDDDPFDDQSNGFDAIFEFPLFAGADTSYWIRQAIPLVGGGGIQLTGRNGILANMRSSKEQGQSNFTNPGLRMIGAGFDSDLAPKVRLSGNFNYFWFDDTSVLEVARQQGSIDRAIGFDASLAVIWRPLMTQNIVVRFSAAGLFPGDGFKQLYGDDTHYSVLANVILTY